MHRANAHNFMLTLVTSNTKSQLLMLLLCITISLYLCVHKPAALVWIQWHPLWPLDYGYRCREPHFSLNWVVGDQTLLLNGCVIKWKIKGKKVNWCFLNHGLWLPAVTQSPWVPGCSIEVKGLLAGDKLSGSAAANRAWLTTAKNIIIVKTICWSGSQWWKGPISTVGNM